MGTQYAMSHADAAWLQMDRPTNLMVITSALWFDAPIDEQRLRDVVRERLVEPVPTVRAAHRERRDGPLVGGRPGLRPRPAHPPPGARRAR